MEKKKDKLCTLQLFVVAVSHSDPRRKTKNPSCCQYLVFTEKSVRIIDYLFNMMITGKEFFNAVTHYLKLWHTA